MIRLAEGSIRWIVSAAFCALTSALLISVDERMQTVTYLFILLTIFFIGFFRDPHRTPSTHPGVHGDCAMLAPADGRVMAIKNGAVQIFMNFHNVHVNRAPISGRIKAIKYTKGSHIPAFTKDSLRNERNEIVIENDGFDCTVTQIAGTITRRIVPYVAEGDFVQRGDRVGMIRFGSRVDMTMPPGFEPAICKGDKVRAGETVIAIKTSGTSSDE